MMAAVVSSSNSCACKGIRSCLICEEKKKEGKKREDVPRQTLQDEYYMCSNCGSICNKANYKILLDSFERVCSTHCDHTHILAVNDHVINTSDKTNVTFGGVVIIKDFINEREEAELVYNIDSSHWVESQSGRRKQDYGPKVNFKKRKIKTDTFFGLPQYSQYLLKRLDHTHLLTRPFYPVELCNLDYNPSRGSAIDPHFDDNWLWGERLITINLLSSTFLTFSHPTLPIVIHVPHPRFSLVIIKSHARFSWKHGITRNHVCERRIAMTFRELSLEFSEKGGREEEKGKELLLIANNFI